jgi:hypothetical protein
MLTCSAIAERMPGPSLRDFRMPESLFTVNTLISRESTTMKFAKW